VRLLPAQYVKPYLKRQKNDAADAEAICEAVTRPTMRFVPIKLPDQQSMMMLHRVRLMFHRQRTQISNALRAHLSEFGVVASIGRNGISNCSTLSTTSTTPGYQLMLGSVCGCSRHSSRWSACLINAVQLEYVLGYINANDHDRHRSSPFLWRRYSAAEWEGGAHPIMSV
jgi:hypothetical protein